MSHRSGSPRSSLDDRLSVLLDMYRRGAFPMARSRGSKGVSFYTADPRCVVPMEAGRLRWARSLRSVVGRGVFRVTTDTVFEQVVRACADVPRSAVEGEPAGTWINDWIIEHYTALHGRGFAHSVEAWSAGGVLVGGLYGVSIGAAFFGESMFCLPEHGGADASKVCFVHLTAHLRRRGFLLLDSQFANPHMLRLGAVEIPLDEYLARLAVAVERAAPPWEPFRAFPEDGDSPCAG